MRVDVAEDWLTQLIDMLRPGWRGRLHVRSPEQGADERAAEIVGTIVGEPLVERDPDDGIADGYVTMCANYRGGRFGPTLGEPYIDISLSWVVDAEAM